MDNIFTQDSRLLAIRLPADSDIQQGDLLLHRLEAHEAIGVEGNDLFHCEAECYSSNGFIELKDVLGQPVEISILQADGNYRLVSGIVTSVAHMGSNGGFTLFKLRIASAFAILSQRTNCRVFQDMTVPEIVAQIFQEHIVANPVFAKCLKFTNKLTKDFPSRSYCTQLYESDARFIARLLAEEGICSMHLHGDGDLDTANTADTSSAERNAPITHQFVLIDDNSTYPTGTADSVSFHAVDASSDEDSIFDFTATRQITASQTSFISYEYKSMSISSTNEGTWIQQGDAGTDVASTLEDYSPQTHYYGQDQSDLDRYTVLRQQAKDVTAKLWNGQGTVRNFAVGSIVTVTDHPVLDQGPVEDRDFLILKLSYTAVNNLSNDELKIVANINGTAHSGSSQGDNPYVNHFTAIRSSIPFVPAYTDTLVRPIVKGTETAIVVGPPSEEIFTDSLGRVCIQFHWQRAQDHPDGGANYDDKSSTWVRVVMPAAGGNFGQQMIPRVGQEVLILFLHGDPDRPICIGVVHSGILTPPTFSGAGSLPANKTLSGIKTKEYKGTGYNEIVFDDTTGQLRAKLSSEVGKTQLNMGYLIHPRSEGKGIPRGWGWELRSDLQGVLRAQGILISADARKNAGGNQLDRAELIGVMQVLESLHQSLAKLASTHKDEKTDTEKFTQIKTHLENWENGTNTKGGEPDPTGSQPIIAVTAPAGIAVGSQTNIALAAEHHIDVASNRNVQISAGRKLLARAVESISLFAHKLHIKLIAASGKVQIEAHNNNIEMLAAKKVIISGLEEIVLRAPKITMETNGAKETWGDGAITSQCTAVHTMKAGKHDIIGPDGSSTSGTVPTSSAKYDEKFVLRFKNNKPAANIHAAIVDDKGATLWSGATNAKGEADILKKDVPNNIHIKFIK